MTRPVDACPCAKCIDRKVCVDCEPCVTCCALDWVKFRLAPTKIRIHRSFIPKKHFEFDDDMIDHISQSLNKQG